MANITETMFNRQFPAWNFAGLVNDRLSGQNGGWTERELALSIMNRWLAHQDLRYDDVVRDIRDVRRESA
jgi:hypothetical protein